MPLPVCLNRHHHHPRRRCEFFSPTVLQVLTYRTHIRTHFTQMQTDEFSFFSSTDMFDVWWRTVYSLPSTRRARAPRSPRGGHGHFSSTGSATDSATGSAPLSASGSRTGRRSGPVAPGAPSCGHRAAATGHRAPGTDRARAGPGAGAGKCVGVAVYSDSLQLQSTVWVV